MFDKRCPGWPALSTATPFIQRYATTAFNSTSRDDDTYNEPLSEAVALTRAGLTIAPATRLTSVRQETTDDR